MRAMGEQSSWAVSPKNRFWPRTKPESRPAMRLMASPSRPSSSPRRSSTRASKSAFGDLLRGVGHLRDGAGDAAHQWNPEQHREDQRAKAHHQPRCHIEEQPAGPQRAGREQKRDRTRAGLGLDRPAAGAPPPSSARASRYGERTWVVARSRPVPFCAPVPGRAAVRGPSRRHARRSVTFSATSWGSSAVARGSLRAVVAEQVELDLVSLSKFFSTSPHLPTGLAFSSPTMTSLTARMRSPARPASRESKAQPQLELEDDVERRASTTRFRKNQARIFGSSGKRSFMGIYVVAGSGLISM